MIEVTYQCRLCGAKFTERVATNRMVCHHAAHDCHRAAIAEGYCGCALPFGPETAQLAVKEWQKLLGVDEFTAGLKSRGRIPPTWSGAAVMLSEREVQP